MNRDAIEISTIGRLGWLVVAVVISFVGVPRATAGTIAENRQTGEVLNYLALEAFSPGFLGI